MIETYKRSNQHVFKNKRINIRQMEDMMRLGKAIGKTIFFYGGAGLGKSQKMAQIARKMFPNSQRPLCDVRLSDKEPQDIAGIQIPIEMEDGTVRTVFAVPDFWPTDPNWEGIVFLDELPNAGPATQQSAYQVVLDHIAGSHKFPVGAVYAGAGNRDTDNGATNAILGPLVNRMIMCEVDYDLDVWIEDFAIPFRVHPIVIGFLKQFQHHFYTGDVENRSTDVFASPRQWETVSRILYERQKDLIDDYIAEISIQGSVGEGLDTEVFGYFIRADKLPSVESIMDGTTKVHHIDNADMDLIYVLSQMCLRKLEDEVVKDKEISDEKFVERAGNFLTFMNNNYGKTNRDIIVAMVTGMFRQQGDNEALVRMNPRRKSLGPLLRKSSPTMMTIVMEYMERYGDVMEVFEKG